jgi:selenocysteine lyase/cysteine desulfurase
MRGLSSKGPRCRLYEHTVARRRTAHYSHTTMTTHPLPVHYATHTSTPNGDPLACQRHLFAIADDVHYLNCAYMAPLAHPVEAAARAALERHRDPSGLTTAMFFEDLDRVRQLFARMIGADDWDRVALVPSVSYSLQLVTSNSRAKQGQNIVVIGDEFPSAILPWHRLGMDRRVVVRTVHAPRDATPVDRAALWSDKISDAISNDTAAVMLSPVHWCDGTRFDLPRIAARAHTVGADVVIDGTQSLGALPFDFAAIQPDAVVCAGYKWLLGGYGLSLAYLGPTYDGGTPLEENWTSQIGSEDFSRLMTDQPEYRTHLGRYDAGQRANPILVPMLETALTQLLTWGIDRIQSYCSQVIAPLRTHASSLGLQLDTSPGRASHIVGVRFPDHRDIRGVAAELRARNVHVSVRGDALRIAPNVWTTDRDVQALLDGLTEPDAGKPIARASQLNRLHDVGDQTRSIE